MRHSKIIGSIVALAGTAGVAAYFLVPSNVDPAHKFSWSENAGWMNWLDADGGADGVFVDTDFLSGYVWMENSGWLNVGNGGGPYANTNDTNFGVNILPGGDLEGFAWGENIGWINFEGGALATPPNPARFDGAANRFRGYAWGENIGWINLDDATHYVAAIAPPPEIIWDSNPLSADRTTRSLVFTLADGSSGEDGIKVTMIDLQNPNPPNLPQFPPPNFGAYESGTCTATGEANGCARWVGKPGTFLESQDLPLGAANRAARLQCMPYYTDWVAETASGPITVVGAEITPSSTYSVQAYAVSCKGVETGCTAVSAPVTMYTRRSGDVEAGFCPPTCGAETGGQPNVTDVAQLVNKFKNVTGAPVKAIAQLQPNLPELNADINALDIVAVVDAVKQKAYAFSGPCACPSLVTCGLAACTNDTPCVTAHGAGSKCVKTCVGGANAGDPCINNTHCPGSTCGAGFCRDRCGRCSP